MSDLTREEAIQILSTRDAHGVLCGYTNGVTEALDMAIEALQFVEHFDLLKEYQSLQEVVYCKDCDRGFGSLVCPIQSQGWAINKDTFYCAWGERRSEVM